LSKLFVAAALALVFAGCGDDDCPNLTGVWKIMWHCDSSLVNQTVTVIQSGCGFTCSEPFGDWTGVVDPAGIVTTIGPAGPDQITCNGSVIGASWSLACTPSPCQVTLVKQ
jgi:hypothetical protein